ARATGMRVRANSFRFLLRDMGEPLLSGAVCGTIGAQGAGAQTGRPGAARAGEGFSLAARPHRPPFFSDGTADERRHDARGKPSWLTRWLGGRFRLPFLPPLVGLVLPARGVVELHQSLQSFAQADLARCGGLGPALLHPLVAGQE